MRNAKQVRELTGVTQKTLRYWDDKGILSPERSESGYRYYSNDDLIKVFAIRVLQGLGYSLKDIAAKLEGGASNTAEFYDSQIAALERKKEMIDGQIAAIRYIKASKFEEGADFERLVAYIMKYPEYAWILQVLCEGTPAQEDAQLLRERIFDYTSSMAQLKEYAEGLDVSAFDFEEILSTFAETAKHLGMPGNVMELVLLLSIYSAIGRKPDDDEVRELVADYLDDIGRETGEDPCEIFDRYLFNSPVFTLPWEDGDNPYAYVTCPHCGHDNTVYGYGEDDD